MIHGTSVAPALTDWIACYTPANTDITKTVPVRYQIGENVCVFFCAAVYKSCLFIMNR